VVNDAGGKRPIRHGPVQGLQDQAGLQALAQFPPHDAPRKGVQNHGQKDELLPQVEVGDIGNPDLMGSRDFAARQQVRVDRAVVARIGGHHESSLPKAE